MTPVTESTPWKDDILKVKIGIFADNMYDLNIGSQSIAAEGLVWLSWPAEFQSLLDRAKLPIEQVITPVNRVNSWDSVSKALYAEPIRLPNGDYHQVIRFANRFYAPHLDLRRYPFEQIKLPIIFGFHTMNEGFDTSKARLVADTNQSGVGAYIDTLGLITDAFSVSEFIQEYPSSFGYQLTNGPVSSRYSQVQLEVAYSKSKFAAILQLFLPLVVVMLMVLMAPNLAASLWDVRIAIPSTALLTLVFLQQGYRQSLPLLPYLTYIDQIYGICYIITFALFLLFVKASNALDHATDAQRDETIARLNRHDKIFQWGAIAILLFAVIANYLFPLRSIYPHH
jgi:hypothetical protein